MLYPFSPFLSILLNLGSVSKFSQGPCVLSRATEGDMMMDSHRVPRRVETPQRYAKIETAAHIQDNNTLIISKNIGRMSSQVLKMRKNANSLHLSLSLSLSFSVSFSVTIPLLKHTHLHTSSQSSPPSLPPLVQGTS